jgi:F-type H+-transporting ATPase subunit b
MLKKLLIVLALFVMLAPTRLLAEAAEQSAPLLPDPTSRETYIEALWTVIIFVVLLAVLYPTAWKSVLAGLKKREERIRSDIAEAESARAKAEATLKEFNDRLATAEQRTREMLSQAAADGEKIATSIRMKAQTEAEEIKERATREIEATRDAALREIYEKTAELATSVAEKIIRRNLNASDQQDLVRQSLDQLQAVK